MNMNDKYNSFKFHYQNVKLGKTFSIVMFKNWDIIKLNNTIVQIIIIYP